MTSSFDSIEEMLPGYFSGEISDEARAIIDAWRQASPGHEKEYQEVQKAWNALTILHQMEKFNAHEALHNVHNKIQNNSRRKWLLYLQRAAAVLILPLLFYAGFLTLKNNHNTKNKPAETVWQTISTPPGLKAHFYLPDSTSVWLNSSSSVTYPVSFTSESRQVKLSGEAFFDVKENLQQPFVVSIGKLNVNVLGTRFNIINYENENQSEVILESGKISMCQSLGGNRTTLTDMKPGELALFDKVSNNIAIKSIQTDKYTSWINGKLIFRDDNMNEVVRKLNRWFNVEIEIADPVILSYIYTATFQDESLDQILELLTLSAPIRYQIIQREKQNNDLFSTKRIILRKRNAYEKTT